MNSTSLTCQESRHPRFTFNLLINSLKRIALDARIIQSLAFLCYQGQDKKHDAVNILPELKERRQFQSPEWVWERACPRWVCAEIYRGQGPLPQCAIP